MSTRWQYQVIEIKQGLLGGLKQDAMQETLTRQGQQGWELVQVVAPSTTVPALAVFKRPG